MLFVFFRVVFKIEQVSAELHVLVHNAIIALDLRELVCVTVEQLN